MAPRKEDDLFSTSALVPFGFEFSTSLAPTPGNSSLAKAERFMEGEAHKLQLALQERQYVAEAAQRAIGAILVNDVQTFTVAADAIWDARMPNGRDVALQQFIDHYAVQEIQALAGSLRAVTIQSAQVMLGEATRSLYRETKETSMLARLLGRDE